MHRFEEPKIQSRKVLLVKMGILLTHGQAVRYHHPLQWWWWPRTRFEGAAATSSGRCTFKLWGRFEASELSRTNPKTIQSRAQSLWRRNYQHEVIFFAPKCSCVRDQWKFEQKSVKISYSKLLYKVPDHIQKPKNWIENTQAWFKWISKVWVDVWQVSKVFGQFGVKLNIVKMLKNEHESGALPIWKPGVPKKLHFRVILSWICSLNRMLFCWNSLKSNLQEFCSQS